MSEDKKQKGTLTDEDMVTSPKLSRRVLLATAGVALGAAAVGGKSAFAEEMDKDNDASGAEDKDPDDGDAEEMDKDSDAEGAEDKDPDEDDKEDKDKDGEEEMDSD